MAVIKMLGTGHGSTLDLYNTCFVIQNNNGAFLVDTGGGMEIIRRLELANIKLEDVNNIFISHSHTDHILGLIWMFKILYGKVRAGKVKNNINIYCNDVVYEAITTIAPLVLPSHLFEKVISVVNFVVLDDGDKHNINGVDYQFFDILAKGVKQFGFECSLDDNRFIFLGDESFNTLLAERVRGADYVTHEAFCLDKDASIFHPYEKNHSTALSAARVMEELDVKNLILYHTEESHGSDKKALYTEEAKSIFSGNVIVPNDLEEIQLVKKII